jgi:hypothetical protein
MIASTAALGVLVPSASISPFGSRSDCRQDATLACQRLIRAWKAPEENATTTLPGLFPWELPLPWAPSTVRENRAVCPGHVDLARGPACAKVADASTNRKAGTSATARIRNASGRSSAGRRLADRPDVARMSASKPAMPRPRRSAVAVPRPRPNRWKNLMLRPRVVTQQTQQQKFFSLPLCDRPGCYEPPVTSSRNPARFCCAACRGAVGNVRDRERKWLRRGTLEGRTKRTIEYQAARRNRSRIRLATSADVPPRPPPQ